jgi:hypothetical protein
VKFFEFINKAQVAAARRLAEHAKKNHSDEEKETGQTKGDSDSGDDGSNADSFLTVIQRVRAAAHHIPEESIWGRSPGSLELESAEQEIKGKHEGQGQEEETRASVSLSSVTTSSISQPLASVVDD